MSTPAPAASPSPPLQTADIGDARLHYIEEGSGTPVVFVHGAGGDWRTWEPLRPYVSPRHRFISYSRRYHWPNDTSDLARPYNVPAQAEDLIAFIGTLGCARVHVVGGSYGGRVVLEAATRQPDLFMSVAASEAAITPPPPWRIGALLKAKALADDLGKIAEPMRRGDTVAATMQLARAVYGDPGAWEKLSESQRQRFLDNKDSWIALAKGPQAPPTSPAALACLPMPVLVLEGEKTVAGFRVTNDQLVRCLPPGAQRYVVPGAPHMWYPVNPGAAAERILEFIARAER